MQRLSEASIEGRMLAAARRNGLPLGKTSIVLAANELPWTMTDALSVVGTPLIAAVDHRRHWTLLGTQAIVTYQDGRYVCVRYDQIERLSFACEAAVPAKSTMEIIVIWDRRGTVRRFWAPPGPEFFALMNIVQCLVRLRSNA